MKEKENDLFDKIMGAWLLKPLYPIYKRYKEGLLYLFFGGLTFLLVVCMYAILDVIFGVDPLVANVISWLSGVTFSFFTTRKWVFNSAAIGRKALLSQMAEFGGARLATLFLQELFIYFFVTCMGMLSLVIKLITEIINIVLNYLVSKFIIFRK